MWIHQTIVGMCMYVCVCGGGRGGVIDGHAITYAHYKICIEWIVPVQCVG